MAKIWAQREKQIEKITLNIAGMRGDLEGIVGASLPAVKILELSENIENAPKSNDKTHPDNLR